MRNLDIRCLLALACGVPLACSSPSSSSEGVADEAESMDSSDSTDSTGSAETSEDSSDTTSNTGDPPPDLPSLDPNQEIPPPDAEGCHAIYAQELLPTFELTITPEVWDMMVAEWAIGEELKALDQEFHPEHPLEEFRYGDVVIHTATIRLRGNPNNWDPWDKMQFEIDFNDVDPDGRFLGLRKLVFDAPTLNRHMLRDRLGLWIMRDMGIDAPCANNARLDVNGQYYGLFTNIEKLDKEFLQRVFEDPSGDLWKRSNWELKTNETTSNDDRIDALRDAASVEELETYLDLEQALRVFAAEAIIPDSDGLWAGGLNFYIYDEPIGGKFVLLPWDLDNVFEKFDGTPEFPTNPDPVVWFKPTVQGRPWYDLALESPVWFDYYIGAIEAQYGSSYDAQELHGLVDLWIAQIQDSVFEDVNKPFSNDEHQAAVQVLHDYIDSRHAFLDDWLQCWQDGGKPDDLGYCVL
jgi:hypothetical protein